MYWFLVLGFMECDINIDKNAIRINEVQKLSRNFSFKLQTGFRNVPVYYRILPVKTRNEAVINSTPKKQQNTSSYSFLNSTGF